MNTEIIKNLEKIALNKTIPFCYECSTYYWRSDVGSFIERKA